jgi:DNA-binding CsgD family transcriptional regulator
VATSPEPALLERERELAELDGLLADARVGTGRLLLVEAAAGLGKTRLLREARRRAALSRMRVLTARATELERDFPFGVVRQLLEPPLAAADQAERAELFDGPAAAALPLFEPDLPTGPVGPDAIRGDPSFATLHGLYWLAANLVERTPALVAVDDAHWADHASIRFLSFVLPRIEDLPVLLVVALRPEEPSAAGGLSGLRSDAAARRWSLAPLSAEAVAGLVQAALGSDAQPAFCSTCHEVSGGNPFLLGELITALEQEGVAGRASDAPLVRELGLEGVSRATLLRLARLQPAAAKLARTLAVLGDGGESRHAATLSGLDRQELDEAADALGRAGILEVGAPLRFVHPLVRNAIYSDVPAAERARAHRAAADLLAADRASPERVALQLLATEPQGDRDVVEILAEAARRSLERAAPESAIAYLRRALREPPPEARRLDLLELLVTAAARGVGGPALEGLGFDPLAELAADPDHVVRAAIEIARMMMASGRVHELVTVLDRAIEAAEAADDLDLAIELDAWRVSWDQSRPGEARTRFSRYYGRIVPDSRGERLALALEAWWGSLLGEPAETSAGLAWRALADGRIFYEQPDSPHAVMAMLVLIRADELERAEHAIELLLSEARDRGTVIGPVTASYLRGYMGFRRGALAEAEVHARSAVEAARLGHFLRTFSFYSASLIDVLIERGDLVGAERELAGSATTGEWPDVSWSGHLQYSRGCLRLAQARVREGADELLELARQLEQRGITGILGTPAPGQGAKALAALGEPEAARELAEAELAKARRWGTPGAIGTVLAARGVVEGGDRGAELLSEAVGLLERSPARLEHARALTDLGALLRRAGHRSEAREPLRAGFELARRCGALPLAKRAHGELGATGEKLRRFVAVGVESLTPSERRIAEMAAKGLTNRQIAQELFLTVKTIETHLHATYEKLDIPSRQELPGALDTQRRDQPADHATPRAR